MTIEHDDTTPPEPQRQTDSAGTLTDTIEILAHVFGASLAREEGGLFDENVERAAETHGEDPDKLRCKVILRWGLEAVREAAEEHDDAGELTDALRAILRTLSENGIPRAEIEIALLGWKDAIGRTGFNQAHLKALLKTEVPASRGDADQEGMEEEQPEKGDAAPEGGEGRPIPWTESAVAESFALRYAGRIHFVAETGKWLRWNGTKFEPDEVQGTLDLMRRHCQREAQRAPKKAKASYGTVKKMGNALKIASARRDVARKADAFDTDDYLLNTPGGIVDLRTGALLAHDPSKMMTKITRATPRADAPMPRFSAFLERVSCGDADVKLALQLTAGTCLSGAVNYEVLFFLHGAGDNGKSVFVSVLHWLFGDYAVSSRAALITKTHHEEHPTILMSLRGARFCMIDETPPGGRWDEERMKLLASQSGQINAHAMRMDEIQFKNTCKLVICSNDKPKITDFSDGWRRRFWFIPFDAKIAEGEKNPNLVRELIAEEGDAIMRWALEGWLQIQREGSLRRPARIERETTAYFDEENKVKRWIDECCEVGFDLSDTAGGLYSSFKAWCGQNNEQPLSQKKFGQSLDQFRDDAGEPLYRRARHEYARLWFGLRRDPASVVPDREAERGSDRDLYDQ